ncbi:hypothetical protein ACTD5D_06980 [Nocardia takedensis]|uniref:hypothetical protein n=1 Tax=Nocardia takedensis TaxID=259390 RepID=UPI000301B3A8|nr:hypothetical protein [Nocardia takedensis]
MAVRPGFVVAGGVLVAVFAVVLGIGAFVGDPDGTSPATGDAHGLSEAASGYRLVDLTAPATPDQAGPLRFRVTAPDGAPLTRFATRHEKKLHLIVVRTDTAEYRHAHPVMDAAGLWSVDWKWNAPGTYRVFADFAPETPDSPGDLVLSDTVVVAGEAGTRTLPPAAPTATVDGYTVTRQGELTTAGGELRFTVTRAGAPVTDLEPYLGANAHLVALRAADLAYLHVHPQTDGTRGPEVVFHAQAPSAGAYRLYLDFAHGGVVRTAEFTVDARSAEELTGSSTPGGGHHSGGGHP